eukprot:gene17957-biopygen13282
MMNEQKSSCPNALYAAAVRDAGYYLWMDVEGAQDGELERAAGLPRPLARLLGAEARRRTGRGGTEVADWMQSQAGTSGRRGSPLLSRET